MDTLHSRAMQEAAQRDMLQLVQRNARLLERQRQLEQVVKDYYGWWKRMEETAMDAPGTAFYREMGDAIPALQERAKVLLEQETRE